jgi:DNA-binding transcriptional MerR regulator
MTLINYEKKGLIRPLRTSGGIRRHRVDDTERLLCMSEDKQEEV